MSIGAALFALGGAVLYIGSSPLVLYSAERVLGYIVASAAVTVLFALGWALLFLATPGTRGPPSHIPDLRARAMRGLLLAALVAVPVSAMFAVSVQREIGILLVYGLVFYLPAVHLVAIPILVAFFLCGVDPRRRPWNSIAIIAGSAVLVSAMAASFSTNLAHLHEGREIQDMGMAGIGYGVGFLLEASRGGLRRRYVRV